mmetsp:Transcript_17887/g.41764  ORF Transcript_17887/g.41764 Transcript_17887/m.41764 type:complete len:176 (-) Transcript_17887:2562-3089(-)
MVQHSHPPHSPHDVDASEYNIFRDSLLRYCGYANEIGESFRYQYPRLVRPTYVVAFAYCLSDSAYSGYMALGEENNRPNGERSKETRAAIASFDTLLWQSLASVAIPGFTINMIVRASKFAVGRTAGLPILISKWLPTTAGLGSIPFIVKPIDSLVDFALDNTTRPYFGIEDERH